MKKQITLIVSSALFGLFAASANAAITYVDAKEGATGNTFATGGSLASTGWIDSASDSAGADNANWMKRFGTGWADHNGADVIQGLVDPVAGNTLNEITTQVTGLADGSYNVWVFFWEQTASATQNWMIEASLNSGSVVRYSSPAGPVTDTNSSATVAASTLLFTNSPSVSAAGGNQSMYGVNLGRASVASGSPINVYVDKLFGSTSSNRTIYDGVGYELIPEPSTAILGGIGAMLLLRRRRA